MGLMQVMLGLALSSAALAMSVSYVSQAGVIERSLSVEIERGFAALDRAWDEYRSENDSWTCTVAVSDPECPEWERAASGILPQSGWDAALFNKYAFKPNFPASFSVTYGNDVNGQYFCASGIGNEALLGAAKEFQKRSAAGQVLISTTCGDLTQGGCPTADTAWGITYWVNQS